MTEDERARLRAAVPGDVREVCRVLTAAGFQAVTVGGAVRDALCGRDPGDWDVATSAHPDEVIARFRRVIPTGLAHGTVTVMVGQGESRQGVEVTTFRGEGAYSDARRPDSVEFGVPLERDLARRDFIVNAIAYDPIGETIHDPFGGRADLAAKRLRAVGVPLERFTEDGLRVMRAVRFAATLELSIDPETEAAIPGALGALARVSQERVHDELRKLLAAPQPSRGLVVAERTGVLRTIAPELGERAAARFAVIDRVDGGDKVDRALRRVAALWTAVGAPDAMTGDDEARAAQGDGVAAKAIDAAMRRLKFASDERDRIVRAARVAHAGARSWSDAGVRRILAGVGRGRAPDAIAVWRGQGDAALAERAEVILARGDALATGELAVTGAALMTALGLPPGRRVGELLAILLERVLDEPASNTAEALIAIARAA
ncbi:MAG: hypothetical protein K8W52_46185 [Deltaproteobacteria bacterium]|nr:hypothetical protein [Deltaproteobacteria bacterium]